MANELRTRTNFVGGLVEDNPLTNVATTLTSAGLAALPVIDTTNHAALILDPDGIHGAPEIVWVTAHSASSTTATIARAQESTSAREHLRDTYWVHTATIYDFEQDLVAGEVGLTGALSIPNGVDTATTWDSVAHSLGGTWWAGANPTRLVVPEDGFYRVGSRTIFDTDTTGGRWNRVTLNGSTIAQAETVSSTVGSRNGRIHTSRDIFCAQGDYFEMFVYQNSGGNLNLNPGSFLQATRISKYYE